MTQKQIIIRPGSTVYCRKQAVRRHTRSSSAGNIAELAGNTAADCTAVWCCCPCTVVNLVVLAVYKVPAGICKKAIRRHRLRQLARKGMLRSSTTTRHRDKGGVCGCGEEFKFDELLEEDEEVAVVLMGGSGMDEELMELEKEMWERFCNTGFWRSPSQREKL